MVITPEMDVIRRVKGLVDDALELLNTNVCNRFDGHCDNCAIWQSRNSENVTGCYCLWLAKHLFSKIMGQLEAEKKEGEESCPFR
ncbi:MAG: hypothetical protein H5U02_00060 [Clostridia bacterium]|nr:hypothetical protein [Clostridia bacterium]